MKVEIINLTPSILTEDKIYEMLISYIGIPSDDVSKMILQKMVNSYYSDGLSEEEIKRNVSGIMDKLRSVHRNISDIRKYQGS
jgi:hypothetical protein